MTVAGLPDRRLRLSAVGQGHWTAAGNAAKSRDFPMLEAGVLVMATIFVLSAAAGDLVNALLDPRQRRRVSP
ncbi:hypothetical protein [Mesorhizobium caraganae]|uniref:hypothetical protein n=1 Tax=Mesorhizobium caraganae TaxID=483206 RepID=UPI003ECCA36B